MATSREQYTAFQRDLVCDAAIGMLAEAEHPITVGIELPAITMQSLATRSGVPRATLYRLFTDNASVIDYIWTTTLTESFDAAIATGQTGSHPRYEIIENFFFSLSQRPYVQRVLDYHGEFMSAIVRTNQQLDVQGLIANLLNSTTESPFVNCEDIANLLVVGSIDAYLKAEPAYRLQAFGTYGSTEQAQVLIEQLV